MLPLGGLVCAKAGMIDGPAVAAAAAPIVTPRLLRKVLRSSGRFMCALPLWLRTYLFGASEKLFAACVRLQAHRHLSTLQLHRLIRRMAGVDVPDIPRR